MSLNAKTSTITLAKDSTTADLQELLDSSRDMTLGFSDLSVETLIKLSAAYNKGLIS